MSKKNNNQHVVSRSDKWAVVGANNKRATGLFDTQKEATERAREIAINKKAEVVIHNKEGKIRQKNSYGNDPCPPKG